mmetsp:Transcript_48051/g.35270  ORF Transcript_48051/g.35270 Transcript_48051/m.35270 type:complete len:102 (-) Transcript_48051:496-801(-)
MALLNGQMNCEMNYSENYACDGSSKCPHLKLIMFPDRLKASTPSYHPSQVAEPLISKDNSCPDIVEAFGFFVCFIESFHSEPFPLAGHFLFYFFWQSRMPL